MDGLSYGAIMDTTPPADTATFRDRDPLLESTDGLTPSGDIRIQVVDAAIATFRIHAFHQVSLEMVAEVASLPIALVEAQFPTWDGLVMATIDRWNGQRMTPILKVAETHGTVALLRGIVAANVEDPSLMRLLTAMLNIAATPNHPMAPMLHQEWRRFHGLVRNNLARDIELGREPLTMEPARGAEQLIALYEGLQLQSMVRPQMDLLDAYDRAVTRLRYGWSHTYQPPVWDLDTV